MPPPAAPRPRRLEQVLASLGYGSRSGARALIDAGAVTVDGEVADDPAVRVVAAQVRVDGEPLEHADGLFVLLHKPVGLVCSHDAREGPRIYDILPPRWLDRNPTPSSVGRLDKDSSGLILVTDDLPSIHRLTSPKHKVDKVYEVTLDKPCPPHLVGLFAAGTLLLEGEREPCAPARLVIGEGNAAAITLTEGRFRQVRRMFAAAGAEVKSLKRTRFGPWELGDLPEGKWIDVPRLHQTP